MWITSCQEGSGALPRIYFVRALCYTIVAMEKLIKAKKVKRARKHGFLVLMRSHAGRKVIKRRRATGRVKLAV